MKKIAIDSYYTEDTAYTVGVVFNDIEDSEPERIIESMTSDFEPYIPGEFYRRELPGVLRILRELDLRDFDTIILDSFVRLKDESHEWSGLGEILKARLEEEGRWHKDLSIWGVAKTNFIMSDQISEKVYRGESKKPLYVQSTRDSKGAALLVRRMHGDHRIPTLLKILDKETKKKRERD